MSRGQLDAFITTTSLLDPVRISASLLRASMLPGPMEPPVDFELRDALPLRDMVEAPPSCASSV